VNFFSNNQLEGTTSMDDLFPRLVRPGNGRYLIHKVNSVCVNDRGMLSFTYETRRGVTSQGPCYLGTAAGPTLAIDELSKHGLQSPDEINYVVGYHSGAIPFGQPAYLLRSLDDIPLQLL
jgi:hypothetical protein